MIIININIFQNNISLTFFSRISVSYLNVSPRDSRFFLTRNIADLFISPSVIFSKALSNTLLASMALS